MNRKPRIYYTGTDKALMWDRWLKGESLNEIARLFDRGHSSIQRFLAPAGGHGLFLSIHLNGPPQGGFQAGFVGDRNGVAADRQVTCRDGDTKLSARRVKRW